MKNTSTLSCIFWRKIRQEMRIEFLSEKKPKSKLRLTPKQPQDLNIDLDNVSGWSIDNREIYRLLLENGYADYVCNKEFLYEHYTTLYFLNESISAIDDDTLKFINLQFLKLNGNNISVLENVPAKCTDLYLYSNCISEVKLNKPNKLKFLGLGNNKLADNQLEAICFKCPDLRCLDLAYNDLCQIEQALKQLKALDKLRVLSLYGNPISLLKHYWKVVTDTLVLNYFDEARFIKQEKKKPPPVLLPPVVEQKKQQKKQTKKDAKKDAKKQAKKQQQAPPPPPPVVQPVEEIIKDMNSSIISMSITVLQNVKGILLDSTAYPDFAKAPMKFQSNFWLEYNGINGKVSTESKKILFDTAVNEQDKSRITFNENFEVEFQPNIELRDYFMKGLIVKIWKQEPILKGQPDSEEKKPEIKDGEPISQRVQVGIIRVPLEDLLKNKLKKQSNKYRLFPATCDKQCNFHNPLPDQDIQIEKNKKKIEAQLERQKQQLKKQQQAEDAAKLQKKGGKDTKKPPAPDKKAGKKGGKEEVEEKKAIPIPDFKVYPRQYVYVDDDLIIRPGNELLSVSFEIKG